MQAGRALLIAAAAAIVAAGATGWAVNSHEAGDRRQSAPRANEGLPAAVPLGDLAGSAAERFPANIANPLGGTDLATIQAGHKLFEQMNCAGCHGYDAKGGMGPDLTDRYWRYGGTPVQIYKSIYEGRPQGMPAWGKALPDRSIWALTAYVQSLGGAFPAGAYHRGLQGDEGRGDAEPTKSGGGAAVTSR